MSKFYQAPNGRLIRRGGRGRFRKTMLADFGLATCESCRRTFTPDYGSLGENPDPRAMNELMKMCPACAEKES